MFRELESFVWQETSEPKTMSYGMRLGGGEIALVRVMIVFCI